MYMHTPRLLGFRISDFTPIEISRKSLRQHLVLKSYGLDHHKNDSDVLSDLEDDDEGSPSTATTVGTCNESTTLSNNSVGRS